MVRKCIAVEEIAAVDVAAAHGGVRTRARALAMATTAKKRKRSAAESELSSLSNYIQLRSRRIAVQVRATHRFLNSSSDQDVFCCSSNRSSEKVAELVDLERENFDEFETSAISGYNERKETTTSCNHQAESDDLDSTMSKLSPVVTSSGRRSTAVKIPSEFELEEFFAAAEKGIQKQFSDKYNFDIVKDMPLEGSYEWIRLKP